MPDAVLSSIAQNASWCVESGVDRVIGASARWKGDPFGTVDLNEISDEDLWLGLDKIRRLRYLVMFYSLESLGPELMASIDLLADWANYMRVIDSHYDTMLLRSESTLSVFIISSILAINKMYQERKYQPLTMQCMKYLLERNLVFLETNADDRVVQVNWQIMNAPNRVSLKVATTALSWPVVTLAKSDSQLLKLWDRVYKQTDLDTYHSQLQSDHVFGWLPTRVGGMKQTYRRVKDQKSRLRKQKAIRSLRLVKGEQPNPPH